MYGQNPKRPQEKSDGSVLKIVNIFDTIQGEGPFAGHYAQFIRLGGCNLACSFCDTEFEVFTEMKIADIPNSNAKLVVITGGEPFRQNIGPLCEMLIARGQKIQIESNGTLYNKIPDEVEVVCSPKATNGKYFNIHRDLEKHIIAYKILVSEDYNFEIPNHFKTKPIYIQPIDEYDEQKNSKNLSLAKNIAMQNNYILSIQIHKVIGVE